MDVPKVNSIYSCTIKAQAAIWLYLKSLDNNHIRLDCVPLLMALSNLMTLKLDLYVGCLPLKHR